MGPPRDALGGPWVATGVPTWLPGAPKGGSWEKVGFWTNFGSYTVRGVRVIRTVSGATNSLLTTA